MYITHQLLKELIRSAARDCKPYQCCQLFRCIC